MKRIVGIVTPLFAIVLAACSGTGVNMSRGVQDSAMTVQPVVIQPLVPTPAQVTRQAMLTTNVANGFVDPAVLSLLTAGDTAAANSAQFYALQFGRPGAPRQWSGERGVVGSVAVGPYVRVNNLDCRDFTHMVTANGQDYVKKGTACREQDGNWTVVQGAA